MMVNNSPPVDKKKKGVSVRKALGDISNRIVHGAHEVNNTKQHQKTTELEIESAAIDKTLTDIELWPTTINTNTPSWYNNQNSSIDASYNY